MFLVNIVNNIDNLDKVKCGKDLYTLIVDYYADKLAVLIKQYIATKLFNPYNEKEMIKYICEYLGNFNKIFEYESNNLNYNLINNNSFSSSDDSNSSDSKNNDESDNTNKNDDSNSSDSKNDDSDDNESNCSKKRKQQLNNIVVNCIDKTIKRQRHK